MSILIKGMEMPMGCAECYFLTERFNGNDFECVCDLQIIDGCREQVDEECEMGERSKTCPLIEVPPHGRLIDADALIDEINNRIKAAIKWGTNAIADREDETRVRAEQAVATFCEASLTAKKLPTIIEAEADDRSHPFADDVMMGEPTQKERSNALDALKESKAYWIDQVGLVKCPFCQTHYTHSEIEGWNYCPNCGGKVEKEEI